MMDIEGAQAVRFALQAIPKSPSSSVGSPPSENDILLLPSHVAAIDPEVSLVIGNRGMGKTFWANALVDEDIRNALVAKGSKNRISELHAYNVTFGFSDRQGTIGVSSLHVSRLRTPESEDYWRAVLIKSVGEIYAKFSVDEQGFEYFRTHPEKAMERLIEIDREVASSSRKVLVVFDQLDQLADNWTDIQKYTKGLLKLALACKSYRSIKIKIFMRPDQASDNDLFRFPDASKITGSAANLRWFASDLFALMYKYLWADLPARRAMERELPGLASYSLQQGVPSVLLTSFDLQGRCFDLLAGLAMGGGAKRGRPYTWLITHLADGRQQISPRSFLTAIRVAADVGTDEEGLALDYRGIQRGVSAASELREEELYEDYPWIFDALSPLRGVTVPVERGDIYGIWQDSQTAERILRNYKNEKAPVEIVLSPSDPSSLVKALEDSLIQLGVFEDRQDSRINVPDIFRISAGMKRKGGVPPQNRRRY